MLPRLAGSGYILCIAGLVPGAQAGLIHSYDLTTSFNDQLGGPALTSSGPLGPSGYSFNAGAAGLTLSNALPDPANYTSPGIYRRRSSLLPLRMVQPGWPRPHRHFCGGLFFRRGFGTSLAYHVPASSRALRRARRCAGSKLCLDRRRVRCLADLRRDSRSEHSFLVRMAGQSPFRGMAAGRNRRALCGHVTIASRSDFSFLICLSWRPCLSATVGHVVLL